MTFKSLVLLSIIAVNAILARPAQQPASSSMLLPEGFAVDKPVPQNDLFWPSRPSVTADTAARLRLYSKFARIAFSNVTTTWNCDLCKAGPLASTEVVRTFEYDATRLYLYIAVNHDLKEIITAFRGTVDTEGWFQDFKVIREDVPEFGPNVSVHTGFLESHEAGRDVVETEVVNQLKKYPGYGLHVVGHSMGAALASLQAQALARMFPQHQVKLTVYGLPRVGNQAYADMVNALPNLDSIRFVNYRDPIPHAPPMVLGYYHHDTEVWCAEAECQTFSQCESGTEDWSCSRHVVPDLSLRYHKLLPGVDF